MTKSLIIVESPSKAKTINKYLGKQFVVKASVGHIKNLPKSKLGVDPENNFEATFEIMEKKEAVIKELQKAAEGADKILIATDPDREGEAIAYDIAEEIVGINKNIQRVLFHEITKTGIEEGIQNPRAIDMNMVESQRARRVMDRIVGYKLSPFIWKTVYYGLSAGRVQSVAVRLICEREEAIRKFIPTEYWSMIGEFTSNHSDPFYAKLVKINGAPLKISNKKTADEVKSLIEKENFVITNVTKKETLRNPYAPFITSTLQQDASSRLRFSAKRTMMLAQKLYEGIDLGDEGTVGLITYMRTDSTRVSENMISDVRNYIYNSYGSEYIPKVPRIYKKGKVSQDAHEAIRPTSIKNNPKHVKKYLDKDLFALYELIWNRFVASQMSSAIYEQLSVELTGGKFLFRATGSTPLFRGFLQVYDDSIKNNDNEKNNNIDSDEDDDPTSKIPNTLKVDDVANLRSLLERQHFTKPPARYTESSLVKELEAQGIGRPSTYAQIISTIVDRNYVEQNERKLFATELGMLVTNILKHNFPKVLNVKFTALMEEELETIAKGKNTYLQVLNDFYHPFIDALNQVDKKANEIKKSLIEKTDDICDLCGKNFVKKWGRNGQFMACSGYPKCKNTKPLPEDQAKIVEVSNVMCKECGSQMVVKGGKFGTFLGCSTYPKCTYTQPMSIGLNCPKCKTGHVIERKTKRKRNFYGCSNYPDCDFASWDKPVDMECSICKHGYLLKKYNKNKGDFLKCPECKEEFDLVEEST
ncbi:MAG: type I DNA topoisomerase [Bacteroidetes bacterium]|nr:type I DNA topoisomerase [Bacteroidota bacterium]